MKRCIIIILLVIFICTELVSSSVSKANTECSGCYQNGRSDPSKIPIPQYGFILLCLTVTILVLIIIILLIIIYKLKQNVYCESIGDKVDITKDDFSSKYQRQSSTETNQGSLRIESNEGKKFQLQRQNSKMTIVEFPNHLDDKTKICHEPKIAPSLSKVLIKPVETLERKYMEDLCKAVLSRKPRVCESTSLSNLDEIVNENIKSSKDSVTNGVFDKSASSPLLDVTDSYKITPVTSVEKEIALFVKDNKDTNSKKEYLPLRLPKIEIKKVNDELLQSETNDCPPKYNKTILVDEDDNNESLDDIYDNPPHTKRPVLKSIDENSHLGDIYDNPPIMSRPVLNTENINNDELNDFYDSVPNNKPLCNTNIKEQFFDDVYEDPKCNKLVYNKKSTSSYKTIDKTTEYDDDEYDFPNKHSKGIVVTNDDNSDYNSLFTYNKETCFEEDYINARSLNKSN